MLHRGDPPQARLCRRPTTIRGIALRSEGRPRWRACRITPKAIRLKPDFAEAYNNRGLARAAEDDRDGAIKDYTEAIRLKPDLAETYRNRGNARRAKGNLDGALKDYTEAIRLKPDFADAYNDRGIARAINNDGDGALREFH